MTAVRLISALPHRLPDRRTLASQHLPAVERWVLWLGAGLLLASVLWPGAGGGPRAQVGALCGAAMSLLNARLIVGIGGWASRGPADDAKRRLGILLGLFQVKLGLLAALIYLTLRYLPVAPLWLLLGLLLLPLGICARALEYRPSAALPPLPTAGAPIPDEGERATNDHG